ncbi:hypothetical protein BDR03DRAFT_1011882 [Suillus americanus]|nr:hypothetical protein BDR03DRAFT_1011882 [Suillus americanus]
MSKPVLTPFYGRICPYKYGNIWGLYTPYPIPSIQALSSQRYGYGDHITAPMETLAPTTATPTFLDASAIEGLLFDYDHVVHPEDRDASGEIVDPGDTGNLVPEYDSSNNMDVEMEVKVDESAEEVDMAT